MKLFELTGSHPSQDPETSEESHLVYPTVLELKMKMP